MQTMNGYISNQGRTYVLQVGSRDHLHIIKKIKILKTMDGQELVDRL